MLTSRRIRHNDPRHARPLSVFYPSVGTYTVYLEYEGRGLGMKFAGMHTYVCDDGSCIAFLARKTKPKIGQVITAYDTKWEVWYIEDRPDGHCTARLEPYHKPGEIQ